MYQSSRQLTAEGVSRLRDKNQKKHENKRKQATAVQKVDMAMAIPQKNLKAMPSKVETTPSDSDYWNSPELKEEVRQMRRREEIARANEGWPWVGVPENLLTQAPFALNEYNYERGFFKLPQHKQTSKLFTVHAGMEHPVLAILFKNYISAAALAATCQEAYNMTANYIDHWDITRGDFLMCDKDPRSKKGTKARVGKVVVVTQFRTQKWRGENHSCEMFGLQNMAHSFNNFADSFEILHLHRVPLLTTHLLALVVPNMRNLKTLGVYQCQLIHLGDAMRLLEIIRIDRGSGKTENITLDFYPRFHIGPADTPGQILAPRAFGVTWDNFCYDSRLAIWQIVTRLLVQSRKQGANLFGLDAAFILWLEKSPCWRVHETLTAIHGVEDTVVLANQVDYPHTSGRHGRKHREEHGSTSYQPCCGCKESVLGIFFDMNELSSVLWYPGTPVRCLGCKLIAHLNSEPDHKKQQKMDMVKKWLRNRDGTINDDDLDRALNNRSKVKGMRSAGIYDDQRRALGELALEPEQQRQIKGYHWRSPSIYEVEPTDPQW